VTESVTESASESASGASTSASVDAPDRDRALPDEARARNALGAAVRRLTHAVVGHHAPLHRLRDTASILDGLSTDHESGERRSRSSDTFRAAWDAPIGDGDRIFTHLDRPFSGEASPWGLDIDARRSGDDVVAQVTLRSAHEGAPDRGHGGIVAALFDDVLGMLLQVHQHRAFTGELTVRYEAGTPLHRPLRLVASLVGMEGRKLHLAGELFDGEQRLATAKAIFIRVVDHSDDAADT
jgi:acyl-coenzyme A thioesterase PaaI-like protein